MLDGEKESDGEIDAVTEADAVSDEVAERDGERLEDGDGDGLGDGHKLSLSCMYPGGKATAPKTEPADDIEICRTKPLVVS
jgi:hypothetical protein